MDTFEVIVPFIPVTNNADESYRILQNEFKVTKKFLNYKINLELQIVKKYKMSKIKNHMIIKL